MDHSNKKILIWLPSPLGDAVLSTPALRAIREKYKDSEITFFGSSVNKQVLSPSPFFDKWLEIQTSSPFKNAKLFKERKFDTAVLFKNSWGSAFAVFLAGIPSRVGYSREMRGIFLNKKLHPPKKFFGKFKPESMVNYYSAIAEKLGAGQNSRNLEVFVDKEAGKRTNEKYPELFNSERPLFIFVPGGAFGPSKLWPAERFSELADLLIEYYDANILISVAPSEAEKNIADKICRYSRYDLFNLSDNPLDLQELKAMISRADLVVSNDTGPRHIAIALGRKVVTLFGPNDPAWTDTKYEKEKQIIGKVDCNYCQKPVCPEPPRKCMEAISVDMVFKAAEELLNNG